MSTLVPRLRHATTAPGNRPGSNNTLVDLNMAPRVLYGIDGRDMVH